MDSFFMTPRLSPIDGRSMVDDVALEQRLVEFLVGLHPPRVRPLALNRDRALSERRDASVVRSVTNTRCTP